jgi:ABC-type proline/glycine betaine transport system substrate-binding protein
MKKKLLFAATFVLFVFIAGSFGSCKKDCKTCKQVTYVDGVWDREGGSQEYCGTSLTAIEAEDDFISGNERTTWECH